jgi:vacuolar protein sorting-associated protein 35
MLKVPIDLYKNALIILKLQNYSKLYEHLDYIGRKQMCSSFINSAIENENFISTSDEVISLIA